jgi:hypothetical protein
MTIRTTLAAAALSTVALLSGTSFAAEFSSQLNEAKVAVQTTGKATRQAVVPALNAAYGFNAIGDQTQAQDFLNFARGKLGLSTASAVVATPVVAAPAQTTDTGIIGLRPEAH